MFTFRYEKRHLSWFLMEDSRGRYCNERFMFVKLYKSFLWWGRNSGLFRKKVYYHTFIMCYYVLYKNSGQYKKVEMICIYPKILTLSPYIILNMLMMSSSCAKILFIRYQQFWWLVVFPSTYFEKCVFHLIKKKHEVEAFWYK